MVGGMSRMLGSTGGMDCPCGGKTEVIDSRALTDGRRRRHRCKACGERFTTYEITVEEYDRLQASVIDMTAIKAALRALRAVEKAMS